MVDKQNLSEATPGRLDWIDAAKGAMILLVVFAHAWRGLNLHGIVPSELFSAVDRRIYAFHMPTFFVLSGWFFISSLERKPLSDFFQSRVLRLLWPMALWTYMFLSVKVFAGSYANRPASWSDLLILPVPGIFHMWFLWALFLLSIGFSFLKLCSKNGRIPDTALLVPVVVTFVIQFVPLSDVANRWIGSTIHYAPFFLIGVIFGRIIPLHRTPPVLGVLAAFVFVLILSALPFVAEFTSAFLISLSLTISVLVVLSCYGPVTGSWTGKSLAALGVVSMPIFLAHTIFSASLREALLAIGVDSLWLHISLGTIIGIAGPILLLHVSRRLNLARILGL